MFTTVKKMVENLLKGSQMLYRCMFLISLWGIWIICALYQRNKIKRKRRLSDGRQENVLKKVNRFGCVP
nr:MAG TPA: hypothetical protein [Bacteriophage sp.]